MSELFVLFLNNLLPILLASGAGYLLAKLTNLNPRPVSQVTFYIFSPCLVFTLLTQNNLGNGNILRIMLFSAISILLVGALTLIVGLLLKLERHVLVGMLLTSMFVNAGNYGLPVVLFAFGQTALSYASLFFVTNAILMYTLGVVIASMGTAGLAQALGGLIKIPAVYALLLALLIMRTGWKVPLPLDRTVTLLGNASIPAMLVLLGMQFKNVSWSGKMLPLSITSLMRLVISPALTLLLVPLFGITGFARQASVLQAGMPAAVLNTILATEYNIEPSLITAAVFVTTLLSPLTLTPLLAYLGA